MNPVTRIDLGRTRYAETWELQKQLWELRHLGAVGDTLLFTEHEHVYTVGKGGDGNHLLASDEELKETGTDLFRVDRGGDVTYHGPGQIVGYPILDLNNFVPDIHLYMRNLEEVMILTLASYGIAAVREPGLTGVWVGGEKIGALGVKVSKWVTMHGFALNVNTDLTKFGRIIPCGIFHKGVTSLQQLLGVEMDFAAVQARVTRSFELVFGAVCTDQPRSSLESLLSTVRAMQEEHPDV